jgi:DNA-binding NtrC family response regulator
VTAALSILLVRPWTTEAERLRTAIRAEGLSVRLTRVDFPAALYAALSWGSFDVILFDPRTPSVSHELLATALRDSKLTTPIIVMNGEDVGKQLAALVRARRN